MRRLLLLLSCFILFSSCSELKDPVDPIVGLTRDDYQDLRLPKGNAEGPPIPRMAYQFERGNSKGRIANDRIVSLSVTDKVPLREVLLELARKADVNLELDPRISGGVIFTANRQPFSKVLNRLCNMAGLRYSIEDEFLRVEVDEPYFKNYSLDYLTQVRRARGEIGIATNVFSSIQGGGSAGRGTTSTGSNGDAINGNNSTTKVETETQSNFWEDVSSNIETILSNTHSNRSLRVENGDAKEQLVKEGLSVNKPFALNKQAGLLNVFGTERQHKAIATYLERLRRKSNAQVLIEARIIEVELNENYTSGINWRTLFSGTTNAAARFGAAAVGGPFATAVTATDGVVTLSLKDNDFAGILNFVRTFGTTRTLSSPRLTVLNNQPAVLKVARNEVYFTSTIDTTPIVGSSGGSPVAVSRTVNSTPNTVPVGFLMTVQPSINPDRDEVTLNLRPTVSFIVDRVEDPGIKIAAADANVPQVTSSIPVVAVREMDSVLTLRSGTVAVMGGLMQDSAGNLEKGVPFADDIPIFGNLVKSRSDDSKLSELVILLRATIADDGPAPDAADANVYHRYTMDRRPLPVGFEEEEANADPEDISNPSLAQEPNNILNEAGTDPDNFEFKNKLPAKKKKKMIIPDEE
jgi:general secretion pathway protein D